ncbi:hypothetical protein D3C76_1338390 [compost metagenome]
MPRRFFAGPQHFLGHNPAIDSHTQRQTHALVSRWAFLGVKRVVIGAQLRRGIHLSRNIFEQLLIEIFWEGFGDINIPRQIALGGR